MPHPFPDQAPPERVDWESRRGADRVLRVGAVRDELARRVAADVLRSSSAPTLVASGLLTARLEGRRVLVVSIGDHLGRALGTCVLVRLDTRLPYLRIRPQRDLPRQDVRLGDPTVDDTFRIDSEVADDRSPLARAWARSVVGPQLRRTLLRHSAIDWSIVGAYALHLGRAYARPQQVIDLAEDDGAQLARLVAAIEPATYDQFGSPVDEETRRLDAWLGWGEDTAEPRGLHLGQPDPGADGWPLLPGRGSV